jgi:hypothetical protein
MVDRPGFEPQRGVRLVFEVVANLPFQFALYHRQYPHPTERLKTGADKPKG